MKKRFFGALLCLVMLLCVLTATAYADGTAVDEVSFELNGYKAGAQINDITVELLGYNSADRCRIDKSVLCETQPTTLEAAKAATAADGKIVPGKNYYLVVGFKAAEGYSIAGLTKDKVSVPGYSTEEKELFEDGENNTTYAVFELIARDAEFTMTGYGVGKDITTFSVTAGGGVALENTLGAEDSKEAFAVYAETADLTDVGKVKTATPVTTDNFAASTDYYLVVSFEGAEGCTLETLAADDVFVKNDGSWIKATSVFEDNTTTGTYYAVFELPQLKVTFGLSGYRTDRNIIKSNVTLPEIVVSKPVVTESDLKATYNEDFVFSTKCITAENFSNSSASVIASDSTEKFLQGKNYYLLVWFTPTSNNPDDALSKLKKDDFTLDVSPGSCTLTANNYFKLEKTETYYVEFELPKLIDHAYFKLENYEQNKAVTDLRLTLDGGGSSDPGIEFNAATYGTDYFIFTNLEEYYSDAENYWGGFESKIAGTTQFENGKTYYLMLRFKLGEGYASSYVMSRVTLDGKEVPMFGKGEYYYGFFRLPVLGAEYINRADVTVTEPVVGALPDVPTISSEKLSVYYYTWYKADAKRYAESDDVYDDTELWAEMKPGERFAAGYYYQLSVYVMQHSGTNGSYEMSQDIVGTINGGGRYEYERLDKPETDYLSISRVFAPLEAHEHTRRQNTTANTADTTAPDTATKTDTVTSADTFDAGIALYAALGALSLTGGAWLTGKKRS